MQGLFDIVIISVTAVILSFSTLGETALSAFFLIVVEIKRKC